MSKKRQKRPQKTLKSFQTLLSMSLHDGDLFFGFPNPFHYDDGFVCRVSHGVVSLSDGSVRDLRDVYNPHRISPTTAKNLKKKGF